MEILSMRKSVFKRVIHLAVLLLVLSPAVILFQNCGNVSLGPALPGSDNFESVEKINETVLQIPSEPIAHLRALFVVDVSNSMVYGTCADSIDALSPNVQPHESCLSTISGVDAEGRRFRALLKWTKEVQTKLSQIPPENRPSLKLALVPFSNRTINGIWGSTLGQFMDLEQQHSVILRVFESKFPSYFPRNGSPQPRQYFLDPEKFEFLVQAQWAIFNRFHGGILQPPDISPDVLNRVELFMPTIANGGVRSSGTSMPRPALILANQILSAERTALPESEKARFEVVFISDGVPKPNAKNIENAILEIWKRKKQVCAPKHNYGSCRTNRRTGEGWVDLPANVGHRCSQRCRRYLDDYLNTGSISLPLEEDPNCWAWDLNNMCREYTDGSSDIFGQNLKCGACFEILRQYNYGSPESANTLMGTLHRTTRDHFKDDIGKNWGDWLENRSNRIFQELHGIKNLQRAAHRLRMTFVRIDSMDLAFKTPLGELDPETNWLERAKVVFDRPHRHVLWTTETLNIPLFSDLEDINTYRLAQVYAYPKHVRGSVTAWLKDSDADGVLDTEEEQGQSQNPRALNPACLDGIVKRFSGCLSQGCSANVDLDRDGLNQCEELTLGTSDENPDSDGDHVLDSAEILFALNPTLNDHQVFMSPDGLSAFTHFRRGYPARVDLRQVPEERLIKVAAAFVRETRVEGFTGLLPVYRIQIRNFPFLPPPVVGGGEIRVILVVENQRDASDRIFLMKDYTANELMKKSGEIQFSEFQRLQGGGL